MKIPDSPERHPIGSTVDFSDTQLQQCYESNLTRTNGFTEELCQVRALIATRDVFHLFEGPHSARVNETIGRILPPRLRPELRLWYQRVGAEKDSKADVLRHHLGRLAGEKLGQTTNIKQPIVNARNTSRS